ncbi:MAG: dihydrolipoyl dehydrogenase [bacterium]|nr:dihydrolipoyl dehydrogenase [bacterium]
MSSIYDVIVVGGGPGGYVAALRAARLGGRVALVERDKLGGTCLNRGCIPTKALIASAELLATARKADRFGVKVTGVSPDLPAIMKRKEQIVKQLRGGIEHLCKAGKVDVYNGNGRLSQGTSVIVSGEQGEQELQGKSVILATGSYPCGVPIEGCALELGNVVTSDEMLELKQIPGRLLVIGAGAVGVEFSYIFRQFGSEVTLVEVLPQILPNEDAEVSAEMEKALGREGIRVMTSTCVQKVEKDGEGYKVHLSGDAVETVDLVLLAVGRRACLEGLGLEEAGVAVERRGITVDDQMKTNVPGVYAIGDAVGIIQLAHVASAQGLVAAANAMGGSETMDYKVVPGCTYASPEIASVGLTEEQARQDGRDIKVGRFPFRNIGRALAMGEREGFVKIIADARYGEVLGAHIIGPQATSLISELALAMKAEVTVEEITATIHAHPTLPEAVDEAAMDVLGLALHK